MGSARGRAHRGTTNRPWKPDAHHPRPPQGRSTPPQNTAADLGNALADARRAETEAKAAVDRQAEAVKANFLDEASKRERERDRNELERLRLAASDAEARRELRLSTITSSRGASVALRVCVRDHLGDLIAPGPSLCIYAEQSPGVVAALTEAAAIFAAPPLAAALDAPQS